MKQSIDRGKVKKWTKKDAKKYLKMPFDIINTQIYPSIANELAAKKVGEAFHNFDGTWTYNYYPK